jgi:threonine aldolase
MRQAGVLAAAGIVALETMVERLAEDHQRAKRLAEGLGALPGLKMNLGTPYTNMVFCELAETVPLNAAQVAERLKERGILVGDVSARGFRLVTHYWIDDDSVTETVKGFSEVLTEDPFAQ